MKWKEDTAAFDKMIKNLTELSNKEVGVGFYNKFYGPDNNNLPVAQVAQWQEEGTPKIPSRPMFRLHLHEKVMSSYKTPIGLMFKNVAEGRGTPTKVLNNLGQGLEMDLKKIIDDGVPPPNSKAWADYKGGSTPLTYTGFMQDSVSYKITNKGKEE